MLPEDVALTRTRGVVDHEHAVAVGVGDCDRRVAQAAQRELEDFGGWRVELDAAARKLRAVIAELPRSAGRIRYLRSMFVPDDEICLHIVEAHAIEAVVEAARLAGLTAERIVEAEAARGS